MVDDLMALKEAARSARFNSRELLDRSARNLAAAHAACLASRSRDRFALIEGEIDGHAVMAAVRADGTVVADQRHKERASLLGALEERLPNGALAELGSDPVTSVLTLMRACDVLCSVQVQHSQLAAGLSPAESGVPSRPAVGR